MKSIEIKLERHQLWTLLGPLCLFFTVAFSFLKPSPHYLYIPYAALFGMVVCCRWQMRGLILTFFILAGMILYRFSGIAIEDPLWELGIQVAIFLGCFITTLSFDEAKSLIEGEKNLSLKEMDNLQRELQQEAYDKIQLEADYNKLESLYSLLKVELDENKKILNKEMERLQSELQAHIQRKNLLETEYRALEDLYTKLKTEGEDAKSETVDDPF